MLNGEALEGADGSILSRLSPPLYSLGEGELEYALDFEAKFCGVCCSIIGSRAWLLWKSLDAEEFEIPDTVVVQSAEAAPGTVACCSEYPWVKDGAETTE